MNENQGERGTFNISGLRRQRETEPTALLDVRAES